MKNTGKSLPLIVVGQGRYARGVYAADVDGCLHLELPYPPSVNHYWRRVANRTLISKSGRRYRAAVVAILAERGTRPMTGPLAVKICLCPPDKRRRDLDNCLKALLDALEHGGAFEDDNQITRLYIKRGEIFRPEGKTVVQIRKQK